MQRTCFQSSSQAVSSTHTKRNPRMFNQGDNPGFDLINHAIRMGAVRDVLEMRNTELLRHLNGANAAFLVRSAELQATQAAAMPRPVTSPDRVTQQNTSAQKPIPERGNSNSFQFPWKLHDMLDDAAAEGLDDIVSWTDNGRSFRVHKPQKFVDSVMCLYFKQTKYKSFQRQLNLYCFNRLNEGPSKGGYRHQYFVRGERNLCQLISRNSGGDGASPGSEDASHVVGIADPDASTSQICSSPSALGKREQNGDFSAGCLSTTTPKTLSESIAPTVAVSVGSMSYSSTMESGCSENSDEEATMNGDLHKGRLHKEFQFPWKLYEMLERSEMESFESVVCWQPGDSCFKVQEQSLFVKNILPRFFKQTKYKSFQRQLNLYGFVRVDDGPNKGAYRHHFFCKGKKGLLNKMTRNKLKNADDHTSSCDDTESDHNNSEMHHSQSSGIPAILAAIECAEAASSGTGISSSRLDNNPPAPLSWRQNPVESRSDWTIEVIARETKTVEIYHVHRQVLGAGPKRGDYFARLFEHPNATSTSVCEFGSPEAHVFPMLLDHIYTDSEILLDMPTAYALYSLADQLGVASLIVHVTDFFRKNTYKENVTDLLTVGENFRDKTLLLTTLDRCSEELRSMDHDAARRIKPTLFVEVLKRSKTLSKKYKCSSSRISQLVAACMEGHPSSLTLEVFRRLTDKEYLPYIEGITAIKLLAFEQELASHGSDQPTSTDATLHERCLDSITNCWDDVKQKLQEDLMLASRMKAVSSTILYEILMRTTGARPT